MNQTIKTTSGKILFEKSANGVKGIVLRTLSPEKYFFRVYHGDELFDDYEILHADLAVTINKDAMASFYENEVGDKFLDNSSDVYGWETINTQE